MNTAMELATGLTPAHHVPEIELLPHLTGGLDEALSLGVACHVAMCSRCRGEARRLDAVGGALLDAEDPQPLRAGAFDELWGRIDVARDDGPSDGPWVAAAPEPAPPELAQLGLPSVLLSRLPTGPVRWRYVAPGVRGIDVALQSHDTTARLVRLKAGLVIPKHDHGAPELTLVFTGALTDAGERYARGDLSFRNPGEAHLQRVEAGADCVALVVNGGRLVPMTWAGRLLRLIARP